jgi:hypothetical protein
MEKKKMPILTTIGSIGGVFVVVLHRGRDAALYTTHYTLKRERERRRRREKTRFVFYSSVSLSLLLFKKIK